MVHAAAAKKMMNIETDKDTKQILRRIAALEQKHAGLWKKVIKHYEQHISRYKINIVSSRILFMRRIFGVALTIKTIERMENALYNKMINTVKEFKFSKKEKRIINLIEIDGKRNMVPLERKIVQYNRILNNIKDVILGMNDGLVEVLAAVVGFAAALQKPSLVLLGGIIIAVSGTLSMVVGAYLSTDYERSLGVRKKGISNPKRTALYMGMFYIFGASIPLIPFMFGVSEVFGIITSIVLTSIVLSVVSVIIALIGDTSISKRIAKTLTLSIGAALITITLGIFARMILHLAI